MSTQNSSTPPTPVEGAPETNVVAMPPATVPAPAEPAPKPGRTPGPWNNAQLLELALGEKYCLAAMQERYTPIFTNHLFPPASHHRAE